MSAETFRNTVKVASTSLIANDYVDEGVQLLSLVGRAHDACRYLQTCNRWTDAAWLAKVSLSEAECTSVLRQWASYLISTDDKWRAVELLLSLGDMHHVLQLLYDTRRFATAALFATACHEMHVLDAERDGDTGMADRGARDAVFPVRTLTEAAYAEYGMHLYHIGAVMLAERYFDRAGSAGKNLKAYLGARS